MRRKGPSPTGKREGHPARGRRRRRASPPRRLGRLEASTRPLRAPSGRGRSPTQALGQAGTCQTGSGRAWQHAVPERLGGAGPGCRGGPGGGGRGWSGLAVRGPGAPWDLAATRAPGSWLGAPGQRWSHPFLCPNMDVGDKLRGSPRPQSRPPTLACCHGDQAPRLQPPPEGQWNSPLAACLRGGLREPRAEPLLKGGEDGDAQPLGLGCFCSPRPPLGSHPQVSLAQSRMRPDPGRGTRSRRI